MKQKLTLVLIALFTTMGAWAEKTTVTNVYQGIRVTSASGLVDGNLYTIRANGGSYITDNGSNYVAPNAQNSLTAAAVFRFHTADGGTTWTLENISTGKYWATPTSQDVSTGFVPTDEGSAGSFTLTFSSSNVIAESGGYKINRSSGTMHGYTASGLNLHIYNVEYYVDESYISELTDLSNSTKYNIRNNRGWWAVGSGAADINSTVELSLAFSKSDAKQQFAFIYYDDDKDDSNDGYYLYSVSESKFAYQNGTKLSLMTPVYGQVPTKVTFTTSTNGTYATSAPVVVTVGGQMFGVSTGMSPDIYKYNDASDGGNAAAIYEVGSFDATDALAAIEDLFHPTHTVTFVVKDESDNTLFTSDSFHAPLGTSITAFPSEYRRDFFYTYGDITPVTITGESATNTNIEIVATAKSTAFQYTADTTSPIYYNLNIRSKYLAYNDAATGDVELLTSSTPFNPDAAWAFIGDPYTGFKIINQTNGTDKYLTYTSVVTGSNGGNNNIQFVDDEDFANRYWCVEANTGGFCLRMKENMNIYFHHDNGSNFLRTCSVSEWGSVHSDAGSTLTFASDEDVLIDFYDLLNGYTFGTEIGNFTPTSPWTVSSIESKLSDVKDDIDNSTTSDYSDDYEDLLDIAEKITVVTPPDGYYRLRNAATSKYIRATNIGSRGGVVANLTDPASDVSSVVQVTTIDGHAYMRSNTGWFNWVARSYDNEGYLAASKDKYVHWLGTPYDSGLAFSIALGNGEDSYASYLNEGYYTSQGDEDGTIKGSNGTTAAAAWIFEPATDVTIDMHSDGAGIYYATLYLPFDAIISDATAYTLEESGEYLVPTAVPSNQVPAGTPVLLKGTEDTATATINTGAAFNSGTPLDCALTGTYMATTIDGATDYVLGIKSSVVGFYHWDSNSLGANRAYLDTPADPGVKGFVLKFDDATAVQTIDNGQQTTDASIYNLAGQRINKMQKGINIVNGKKIMIK